MGGAREVRFIDDVTEKLGHVRTPDPFTAPYSGTSGTPFAAAAPRLRRNGCLHARSTHKTGRHVRFFYEVFRAVRTTEQLIKRIPAPQRRRRPTLQRGCVV
ncbi:hypothetical protein MRX96_035678 [Rhipicephalus microplus]